MLIETPVNMRPFSTFSPETRANIRVFLFDIDDTITTDGKLTADAYTALARLKAAGLIVIPITGRPAGWCDHIARLWPVDGVVGENGAFYFYHDDAARKLIQRFVTPDIERKQHRARLTEIATTILREVSGCALASDQHYREADIAIDFCEDVPRLAVADVARIKTLMEQHGMTANISSIHVNGWFGRYDKLSTTRLMLRDVFNIDIDAQKHECIFIGDSPNDQPMFRFFLHSVGVANVRDFVWQLTDPPCYVTDARCGSGFVEMVNTLLDDKLP